MTSLYETDFYTWTQQQTQLLRAADYATVDWDHLIEEVETLGRRERTAVRSSLVVLAVTVLRKKNGHGYSILFGLAISPL
jgi:hypothetical protein